MINLRSLKLFPKRIGRIIFSWRIKCIHWVKFCLILEHYASLYAQFYRTDLLTNSSTWSCTWCCSLTCCESSVAIGWFRRCISIWNNEFIVLKGVYRNWLKVLRSKMTSSRIIISLSSLLFPDILHHMDLSRRHESTYQHHNLYRFEISSKKIKYCFLED